MASRWLVAASRAANTMSVASGCFVMNSGHFPVTGSLLIEATVTYRRLPAQQKGSSNGSCCNYPSAIRAHLCRQQIHLSIPQKLQQEQRQQKLGKSCAFSTFSHNIRPSRREKPASEDPLYYNRFDHAEHPSLWQADEQRQQKHLQKSNSSNITSVAQLVEPISSPHQTEGWFKRIRYWHYKETTEPTFPRPPNLAQGELAAGATVTRTSVWHNPDEPAVVSVGRFSPDHFRPVGYAENVPNPDSVNSDSHPDFREYRLGPGSVDRRPFVYFISASYFFITASMARAFICKWIHFWWVSRDMLAAGTTEVDLRPIAEGTTAVFKWRGKPVFVRHRTPEDIAAAKRDDALVGTMKDPQLDSERCPRPQWLINIGVCTHLGCIPVDGGNYGGWFCPCHGSHYDTSGRIRLGPAPANLELPPIEFLDDHTVKLG